AREVGLDLGRWYLALGHYADAEPHLRRALADVKGVKPLPPARQITGLTYLALAAEKQGERDPATTAWPAVETVPPAPLDRRRPGRGLGGAAAHRGRAPAGGQLPLPEAARRGRRPARSPPARLRRTEETRPGGPARHAAPAGRPPDGRAALRRRREVPAGGPGPAPTARGRRSAHPRRPDRRIGRRAGAPAPRRGGGGPMGAGRPRIQGRAG